MPRPLRRAACAALRRLGGANSVSTDSGQAGGFTRRPYTDGTVRSEELQALMMRRGLNAGHGRIAGRRGLPGTYPPDGPVTHTDRLFAARGGQ